MSRNTERRSREEREWWNRFSGMMSAQWEMTPYLNRMSARFRNSVCRVLFSGSIHCERSSEEMCLAGQRHCRAAYSLPLAAGAPRCEVVRCRDVLLPEAAASEARVWVLHSTLHPVGRNEPPSVPCGGAFAASLRLPSTSSGSRPSTAHTLIISPNVPKSKFFVGR